MITKWFNTATVSDFVLNNEFNTWESRMFVKIYRRCHKHLTVFEMKQRFEAKGKNVLTALTRAPSQLNSKKHCAR
jgi:3-polyprenyl-4-hydroxybenzoate decarboxylase